MKGSNPAARCWMLGVMAGAALAPPAPGAQAQRVADDGMSMRLVVSLVGRATLANAFEPGEPVLLRALLINAGNRPVAVAVRPGLMTVFVNGPGGKISFDSYERRRAHYEKQLGRPLRAEARDAAAATLAPGATLDLCSVVARWGVVSAQIDCGLPKAVIGAPGSYTIRLDARPLAPRGSGPAPLLITGDVVLRVIGPREMARLEARFPVTRAAAVAKARAVADTHFGTAAGVTIGEPIRLRLGDGRPRWDVAFVRDTGLVARWARVTIDAVKGETKLAPFGQGA